MIAKRVPVMEDFISLKQDLRFLKEHIRSKINDEMADEAKICFDFATKLFQQMELPNA